MVTVMKTLPTLMVLAGLVTIGAAAHAAEKKPVVCLDWTIVTEHSATSTEAFAVCRDGKRPVILTSVTEITLLSEDGARRTRAIVGYR